MITEPIAAAVSCALDGRLNALVGVVSDEIALNGIADLPMPFKSPRLRSRNSNVDL